MELRIILDQVLASVPGGIGRYTTELTRALIATAPRGTAVSGFVSASPEDDYARIAQLFPGLHTLHKSALARRELAAAWQHGFTRLPGTGMIHAPSLLAPLSRHDRIAKPDEQIVVTIHDVIPWTHPETLTSRGVTWHKAMARRAERYADAIVVPTHAVAEQLATVGTFGDRIRVIGGAVAESISAPADADAVAARLGLPERYVLAVGTLEPRKALDALISALTHVPEEVSLVIAGPAGWGDLDVARLTADAGLPASRVTALGRVSDEELAVAFSRAAVFAFPSWAEGFGLPVLEAFAAGVPVVHSDDPALVEVAGGAGVVVERDPREGYPVRLAAALASVIEDAAFAERLVTLGRDRARAFSWRDSAEKVWQLHADL